MSKKNPNAVALGRKGGKAGTEAQDAARRANGAKGGRPAKVEVGGRRFEMMAVISRMDDDIREQLHGRDWASDQEFVDAYLEAHRDKFGEDFVIN